MKFVKLFEPITINRLTIKNRIVMPAMALFYTDNYALTDRCRAFYRERAAGGVGLMMIGPVAVDRVGSNPFMLGLFEDQHVGPIAAFLEELHRYTEVRVGVQLIHQGRYASSRDTALRPIAPSAVENPLTREVPRAMTREDIEKVQESFVCAAFRSQAAGFDYIEVIAGGGYLISSFLSPATNRRTDQYGGPIENRMRFGIEIIRYIRQAAGKGFAIGIRVSGHDFIQGGHTEKESALFCAQAEKAGVDAVGVTGGWHETQVPQISADVPPGAYLYLARAIKDHVGVPVLASNRLGDPELSEKALRSGNADMVCWGRSLIADPHLPIRARTGKLDDRVPCIACNGCFDSIVRRLPMRCTVNPRVGREATTEIRRAKSPKKILVAGGGLAGMEFALIAAQRGHDVTLCEKTEKLGGQVNLSGAVPGKQEFLHAATSLKRRIDTSAVKLSMNALVTANMVESARPDLLVVASGAKPATLSVPGIERSNVVSAWDVLSGKTVDIGEHVIVVGGNAAGCETALFVAAFGLPDAETLVFLLRHSAEEVDRIRDLLHRSWRKVTVVEAMERMAANAGRSTRWSLLKKMKLFGIEMRPRTKLVEVTENAVVLNAESGTESLPADTVILAVGSEPADELARELAPGPTPMVTIGDARQPRNMMDAIREAFDAAVEL